MSGYDAGRVLTEPARRLEDKVVFREFFRERPCDGERQLTSRRQHQPIPQGGKYNQAFNLVKTVAAATVNGECQIDLCPRSLFQRCHLERTGLNPGLVART